ncbi:hypothetical protein HanHA300_Chr07g0238031 [Helianthus annuus]|nr:hypothetical protein HanHA300_Chr07g0238031 [Helianthus annuus]KAJ0562744.1 hypothetical protein HanHA89_Chr07g0255191 [Helianthus annuus]KAJ0728119.1 hypothetical protein HanLR1_Chr07g0237951 [Helianthus annuus]
MCSKVQQRERTPYTKFGPRFVLGIQIFLLVFLMILVIIINFFFFCQKVVICFRPKKGQASSLGIIVGPKLEKKLKYTQEI